MDVQPTAVLSILVVSYNTAELTLRAVQSISGAQDDFAVEVIVIDNGSSDQSVAMIRQHAPEVTVIETGANLGFGKACNIGARAATGSHILLLNPDAILQPGSLRALVDLLDRCPDALLVGGVSLTSGGLIDVNASYGLPSLWTNFCFATGLSTVLRRSRVFNAESIGGWARNSERRVGVVPGFLLLCTRDTWALLDGFDERYFMYGEDVDLSIRARQLGGHPRVTPNAVIVHDAGGTSASPGRRSIMIMKGKVTVVKLRWSPLRAFLAVRLLLLGTWLRVVLARFGVDTDGPWSEVWAGRADWRNGWSGSEGPSGPDQKPKIGQRAGAALAASSATASK